MRVAHEGRPYEHKNKNRSEVEYNKLNDILYELTSIDGEYNIEYADDSRLLLDMKIDNHPAKVTIEWKNDEDQ